ncbi:MAG: LacI family DNA-binding transcriptional regulator [Candidatus Goldbacteria bacterium]|nr:LacI family DNA-binding transcriptional regulator [Candidatus Goldiibacteriota bacterium]
MRVTIKDIAKKVGVTPATVSMVINNSPKISQKTKDLVMQSIKEMNYHPNYIGRSLVKGKTNNIAVVASFFASLFALESVRGIENNLRKTAYNLILYSTRGVEENERDVLRRVFYERRADGFIIISLKPDDELVAEFEKEGLPVVFIEEIVKGAPTVKFNNIKGAFMATEYLIKKKRKKIAIIKGSKVLNAEERFKGYKDALEYYGIPFDEKKVIDVVDYTFEEGETLLKNLMKKSGGVDAVFCSAGDITAIGVMDAAKKAGIKIPQDLSIIGYDDVYLSNLTSPGLTTVRQPIAQMGMQAFDLLTDMIEGSAPMESKIISFEPELIIRDSV